MNTNPADSPLLLNSLSLRYSPGQLYVLDQQALPHHENWLDGSDPENMIRYIKNLQVRGAPMIGVAAALSLSCWLRHSFEQPKAIEQFLVLAQKLRAARPTAVNLMQALDQLIAAFDARLSAEKMLEKNQVEKIEQTAINLALRDQQMCDQIAENGEPLISEGDSLLTICNTGQLATMGVGTALGILLKAHQRSKKIHVYVCETRPLLQGGRLTSWELDQLGISFTLVTDSMAALLMAQKKINKIFVGSDRIARNGDFANKIGTYSLAVLAHHHKIPFYVAAPMTTIDLHCDSGSSIPIEERPGSEILGTTSYQKASVYNPAFDVTPADLVSGWILDKKALLSKAEWVDFINSEK